MAWTLIGIITVPIILVLLNIVYKNTNRYKNDLFSIETIRGIQEGNDSYDIISIGSSQARYAYDFSNSGLKGANLGATPQTLQLDSFILSNIINKVKPNGIIIISVCLLEFFLNHFKNNLDYDKYIKVLNKTQFRHIGVRNYQKAYLKNLFPLLWCPRGLKFILRDVQPKNIMHVRVNSYDSMDKVNTDADHWISLWNKEFKINIPDLNISTANKNNIEKNIIIIQKMVDVCKTSSLIPVFVIPPVTDALLSKFNEEFLNEYLISILKKKVKGDTPVFNYLGNEEMKDYALYMDSFFLNKRGREKFTKILISDLKALLS